MRLLTSALCLLTCIAAAPAVDLPTVELPQKTVTLRFAVVGDTGDGPEEVARGIARLHAAAPLDAIVIAGDAFYPCGPKSPDDRVWERVRPLAEIGPPLLPVLGNHDFCAGSKPNLQPNAAMPHWTFPARQYAVRTRLADFVMLDTTPFAAGKSNAPVDALRKGFNHAPWRIAVGHHPLLSSGYHGHFPRAEHERMLTLLPEMRREHIDLYLCGHDHHLELIDANPRMLVSGAGSDPVPPILLHARTLFPREAERVKGFAIVELDAHTMKIQFFDAAGGAKSGVFQFTK